MILSKVKVQGFAGALRETFELDCAALGPGVFAIAGDNGAGKTTLLEAMCPAPLYRVWPSYGEPLPSKVFPGCRNAGIELEFEMAGHEHSILVRSDPMALGGKGRSEATWLVDGKQSGGPLLTSFDAERDRWFPSLQTILASVFKAQRVNRPAGSFFALQPADRKRLFAEMLGLDECQAKSQAAADRAKELVRAAEDLAREAERLAGQAEQRTAWVLDRGEWLLRQEIAARTLEERRAAMLAAQREMEAARGIWNALETERVRLTSLRQGLERRVKDLAARKRQVDGELLALQLPDTTEPAAATPPDIPAIQARLAELEVEAQEAAATFTQLDQLHRYVAERQAEANRLLAQTAALQRIEAPDSDLCRRCPLTAHARDAQASLSRLRETIADALRLSDRPVQAKQVAVLEAVAGEARAAVTGCKELLRSALHGQAAAAKASEARAAREARREALLQQADGLQVEVEAAQLEFDSAPQPLDTEAELAALKQARQQAENAEAAHESARQGAAHTDKAVATLSGKIEALGDPEAEGQRVGVERTRVAREAEEWLLVARGLGPDGVQALEIDNAGPSVSAIANDLLASCYGPRFSLELVTTKPTKDGAKMREVFEVRFIDAEAQRSGSQGSGGETVILDEALSLSLATFNRLHCGHDLRTLWRDETAGALSPANALAYLQMLRRAREVGAFHQVWFIAHQPELWQGADGVVRL